MWIIKGQLKYICRQSNLSIYKILCNDFIFWNREFHAGAHGLEIKAIF